MLDRIFIVVGSSGSYSDYTQWNVAAYTDLETANLHASHATKWVEENRGSTYAALDYYEQIEADKTPNPFDRHMHLLYDGVDYTVESVLLYLHPDEYLEKTEASS